MNNRAVPLILCIDDDADTRRLLHYLLQHGNYEVITASDGRQGMQLAQANQPDVILLDVEMPGLNGYEVCLQLQKNPITAYIPVVFVTSRKSDQDRKKALAAGGADFLTKPFHMNPLLHKILLQLRRSVQWQQLKEPQTTAESPSSGFLQFKKTTARKLGFSPDKYARWLQTSSLQLYEKAVEFGITHYELAQLIAEFIKAPYIQHIRSHIIRIGVMPSAFSKANTIVAVDSVDSGLNFILSNPFNPLVLDAMKKCTADDTAVRFAVTEPANIAGLFERPLRDQTADPKQSQPPVHTAAAQGALSVIRSDTALSVNNGNQGFPSPEQRENVMRAEKPLKGPSIMSLAPTAPELIDGPECRRAPPSILVVDDDPAAQLLVQHFLVADGYQVTLAADGIDALLALGGKPFDLIISDVNMPNLDGYKLLDIIKRKNMTTPVLFVTGSAGAEDEIKGLELGAVDYVRKPLNKEALLFRVKKALGEHRRHLGAA